MAAGISLVEDRVANPGATRADRRALFPALSHQRRELVPEGGLPEEARASSRSQCPGLLPAHLQRIRRFPG